MFIIQKSIKMFKIKFLIILFLLNHNLTIVCSEAAAGAGAEADLSEFGVNHKITLKPDPTGRINIESSTNFNLGTGPGESHKLVHYTHVPGTDPVTYGQAALILAQILDLRESVRRSSEMYDSFLASEKLAMKNGFFKVNPDLGLFCKSYDLREFEDREKEEAEARSKEGPLVQEWQLERDITITHRIEPGLLFCDSTVRDSCVMPEKHVFSCRDILAPKEYESHSSEVVRGPINKERAIAISASKLLNTQTASFYVDLRAYIRSFVESALPGKLAKMIRCEANDLKCCKDFKKISELKE